MKQGHIKMLDFFENLPIYIQILIFEIGISPNHKLVGNVIGGCEMTQRNGLELKFIYEYQILSKMLQKASI